MENFQASTFYTWDSVIFLSLFVLLRAVKLAFPFPKVTSFHQYERNYFQLAVPFLSKCNPFRLPWYLGHWFFVNTDNVSLFEFRFHNAVVLDTMWFNLSFHALLPATKTFMSSVLHCLLISIMLLMTDLSCFQIFGHIMYHSCLEILIYRRCYMRCSTKETVAQPCYCLDLMILILWSF